MRTTKYLTLLAATLSAAAVHAQTVVENFEYANSDELAAAWVGSANTTITVSDYVAGTSTGKSAMQATFNFPSTAYATETIMGPQYENPISIDSTQYLTFRVKGDPAFKTADFRNLYLYAYDADGNFGRWGGPAPTSDEWQVANYRADTIEKPWNSTALPDLSRIVQFAFFQYGSQSAIPEYTATIAIDDLMVRDTPLTEISLNQETVVETFEYADNAALTAAWTIATNAVADLSDSVSPRSVGKTSMRVRFNFPSVAWSSVEVGGPSLTNTVPIGPKQYLTFRIQGDPAFAAADYRTLFLYAYDVNGNFGRWGAAVPTNSDWEIFNFSAATIEKPWNSTALPDLTKVARFAFLQYGSEKAIPAYSATICVDDLMVRNTPLSETAPLKETVVENFEYADGETLAAAWKGGANSLVEPSDAVATQSTGKMAMRIQFNFASSEWVAESVSGPTLTNAIPIGPKQYVTFRIKGDPAFSTSDFHNLYLYVYDTEGNFGRWGDTVPATNDWKVLNFSAATIEKPWNSPGLPDLSQIVRFAFVQYGSQAAIDSYSAAIEVDDIMVRNTPLYEFPPSAQPRVLIDDFEGYATEGDLLNFYSYLNNPAAVVTTASLSSPAPQGSKALKLAVDFTAGQYPWGSVRSTVVAPFSFPTNAAVSLQFKGDPALAPVADAGTSFWITFYDTAGRAMSYSTASAPMISSNWTAIQASLKDFGDTSSVDIGNLVQWRILVQGWQGTADNQALSGVFYVDDLKIAVPAIKVVGTAPAGLSGTPITGIVLDEANRTITADLPKTEKQGFLTISPAQQLKSVKVENGKLVIRW